MSGWCVEVSMRIITLVLVFLFFGCTTRPPKAARANDYQNVREQLASETSLKADRQKLDEMRKGIPEEKKNTNDELALYLTLMNQGTEPPQTVRNKFTALVE